MLVSCITQFAGTLPLGSSLKTIHFIDRNTPVAQTFVDEIRTQCEIEGPPADTFGMIWPSTLLRFLIEFMTIGKIQNVPFFPLHLGLMSIPMQISPIMPTLLTCQNGLKVNLVKGQILKQQVCAYLGLFLSVYVPNISMVDGHCSVLIP